ncbi:MAG TPA: GNAT family N-acetyltransferase [Xanthomonadaceae bacterium]|jgi:ribosomal protein S18 acetylase RimI-like enzyme
MNVQVRRADANDLDTLARLFDAYRQFYEQAGDVDGARAFLAERIAREESVLLIAERDTQAVGFVQLYPIFSSVRMGRVWTLNDLYVAGSARRSGVARALLDAATAFARDSGALGLQLETGTGNHNAQALYRSAGWTQDTNLHFHLDF